MAKMTREEKRQIIDASLAAANRGDTAEESKLIRQLPVPIHLALAMKEMLDEDELLHGGWNFSEVEETYGKDWHSR